MVYSESLCHIDSKHKTAHAGTNRRSTGLVVQLIQAINRNWNYTVNIFARHLFAPGFGCGVSCSGIEMVGFLTYGMTSRSIFNDLDWIRKKITFKMHGYIKYSIVSKYLITNGICGEHSGRQILVGGEIYLFFKYMDPRTVFNIRSSCMSLENVNKL